MSSLVLFSVSCPFVILEALDLMLGIAESIRKAQFQRGEQKGRQEERNLFSEWIKQEREKGSDGFKEDPPFLRKEED